MSSKSGGAKAARKQTGIKVVADNRRARYEYEILQTFEAGLALQGQSGFKSLKNFILIAGAAVVGHHLNPGLFACRFCATAF